VTADSWFAASLVLAVLNERGGLWRRVTSVVLVKADDFEEAFEKACHQGHEQETRYENAEGEGVRWAFEKVATLDMLPEVLVDGTEIYSEPGPLINDRSVPFDHQFDPRASPPGQSGVSPT
jgi:hypothetical protein